MHDIDRTLNVDNLEYDDEFDYDNEFDYDDEFDFEYDDEAEFDFEYDDEVSEDELAAELVAVESDAELDEFVGRLVSSAWRKSRKMLNSKEGHRIRKGIAGWVRSGAKNTGAQIGKYLGDKAGDWMASKIEPEMEMEVAKKLIRFAKDAAQKTSRTRSPQQAKKAIQVAAAQHIKPMLSSGGQQRTGQWVRKGNRIIVTL